MKTFATFKFVFLLSLIYLFLVSESQISAQSSLALKLSPFNTVVLDETRTILPIGIEFKFNRFGIEYEHGFKTGITKPNTITENEKGFRSKLAAQYYFLDRNIKMFTGFSYYQFPQNYTVENDYFTNQNGEAYSFDFSEVEVKNNTFHIFYGAKFPLGPKFIFELIAGAGIKYLDVKNTNVIGQRDDFFIDDFILFNGGLRPYFREEGKYSRYTYIVNFKFAYYLFNNFDEK